MDYHDMMVQVTAMDDNALRMFVTSIRSSATLKLAIRTVSKSKGMGTVGELLLDDTLPIDEVTSFLRMVTQGDALASLPGFLDEHPVFAEHIAAVKANILTTTGIG